MSETIEDLKLEQELYDDLDFAIEHLQDGNVIEILEKLSLKLSKYGHELSSREIIEYISGWECE